MNRRIPDVCSSGGFVRFERSEIQQSIPQRFAAQVDRFADKVAVKQGGRTLTYRQLDRLSNRIAHALLAACPHRREPVILLLEQSPLLIATILGILKSGNIYVPLDPSHPEMRLRYILDDAEARCILADSVNGALAGSLASGRCGWLNVDTLDDGCPDALPSITIAPEDSAYIFYTSGSTGRPKGVVDSHRNVLHNIMRYTNALRIGTDDGLTLLQSASFSGAVSSMFCALLNGATLYPYDLLKQGMGGALGNWLNAERITIYHSVPAIFRTFLVGDARFPAVRIVRLEGDAASRIDVELFNKHFARGCVLVNGLGATETGITRQYFVENGAQTRDGIVPIGFATEDMETRLLDEHGKEVPCGGIGEIAVRSEFLAAGYWGNDDLTAAKFLPDPGNPRVRTYLTGDMGRMRDDGCLEYLGRKDFGLKIRGQRVEAAEVERAILQLDGIREAVVVTREDKHAGPRLVAYIVPARIPAPLPHVLRRELARTLPDFMIPTAYVVMERLPLNANSKVDRNNLPSPGFSREATVVESPRTEAEKTLAGIWESLLGVKPVGIHDNFFDLGGDSLLAVRMLVLAEAAFRKSVIPPSLLLQGPTIAQLSLLLTESGPTDNPNLVPIQTNGDRIPFFCVHGHLGEVLNFGRLSRLLGNDQPFYALRSTGETQDDIRAVAAKYIRCMHMIQPHGPFFLGGYCYGGVVAFEMARQLLAGNQQVGLLALLDNMPADFVPLTHRGSARKHRRHLRKLRIAFHRENLRNLSVGKKVHYVATLTGRRLRSLFFHSRDDFSVGNYIPESFPGQVDVFVPRETVHLYSGNYQRDWGRLAVGGVTMHVVEGENGAMFTEPHVRQLAEQLSAVLERATSSVAKAGAAPRTGAASTPAGA